MPVQRSAWASTKCFSTQLANLLMFAVWLGRRRGALSPERSAELVEGMARLPHLMNDTLVGTKQLVANIARHYKDATDSLYLGRGLSFPIALEGALKLKEISYVHAEGYAAGEMKHGPIALIDADMPVVVLAPKDHTYDKAMGNLQEAKAREAKVIAVTTEGDENAANLSHDCIEIPAADPLFTPFLSVLPLQLYAYYVADYKGHGRRPAEKPRKDRDGRVVRATRGARLVALRGSEAQQVQRRRTHIGQAGFAGRCQLQVMTRCPHVAGNGIERVAGLGLRRTVRTHVDLSGLFVPHEHLVGVAVICSHDDGAPQRPDGRKESTDAEVDGFHREHSRLEISRVANHVTIRVVDSSVPYPG